MLISEGRKRNEKKIAKYKPLEKWHDYFACHVVELEDTGDRVVFEHIQRRFKNHYDKYWFPEYRAYPEVTEIGSPGRECPMGR